MTDSPDLHHILEQCFLLLDEGKTPDLAELCKGDPALIRKVAGMLGREETTLAYLQFDQDQEELANEEIGDFRIVSMLGRGGMGKVFLAEQKSLGRMVALKIISRAVLGDSRSRLRFRREAEITGALDHPNIVPIYAVGEEGETGYIAMKWLTGPDLETQDKPLAPSKVIDIGIAVARGLHEAHLSGVIHRDVKPANILLDNDTPILVDFGLAKRQSGDTPVTRQGTGPGTGPYLPPEFLRSRVGILDPRSDVYSLGATLYELVSGKPPFGSEDSRSVDAPDPGR